MIVRTSFNEDLLNIRKSVVQMGELTQNFVKETIDILIQNGQEKAKEIRQYEKEIDSLYEKIDSLCIRVMATQQPTAGDLRFLISSIKIASELERIADYANNIAKKVQKHKLDDLETINFIPYAEKILSMRDNAVEMLQEAIYAYEMNESDQIEVITQKEILVNELNRELFRDLVSMQNEENDLQQVLFELHSCIRYIERVADRSTNIFEIVFYMVRGFQFKSTD